MDGLKNWKTTVAAVVGAIASLVSHFGLNLGPEVQGVIITLTMLVIGYFTQDADKTGTTAAPQ